MAVAQQKFELITAGLAAVALNCPIENNATSLSFQTIIQCPMKLAVLWLKIDLENLRWQTLPQTFQGNQTTKVLRLGLLSLHRKSPTQISRRSLTCTPEPQVVDSPGLSRKRGTHQRRTTFVQDHATERNTVNFSRTQIVSSTIFDLTL